METENLGIKNIANIFNAFESICRGSVYVIDFKQECFLHVSNHDLFLCGHSTNEILKLGYDFYPEIVHPEDMPLFTKIFNKILTACSNNSQQDNIHYFSFTFRIRIYPQKREYPDYLTVYHKIVPVFVDGQMQFGVCLITCSEKEAITDEADKADEAGKYSKKGSGNLRLYYKDNEYFDKCSLISGRWEKFKIKHLTNDEKIILIHAMSGESNRMIAEKCFMSLNNLQHKLTRLYHKLGVKNMTQAIIHSINHSLIFSHVNSSNVPKQKNSEDSEIKQQKKMTPELIQNIQADLDNRQSVRSIAKRTGVSEGAIRKAVKSGKLTKK
jgi:DNA-binding CsgD family transcriptional regulator